MIENTIFIKEAIHDVPIQQIEQQLAQKDGVERVLIDTADGEIKVQYDEKKLTQEQLIATLEGQGFHLK